MAHHHAGVNDGLPVTVQISWSGSRLQDFDGSLIAFTTLRYFNSTSAVETIENIIRQFHFPSAVQESFK